jgi:hypothetical protein
VHTYTAFVMPSKIAPTLIINGTTLSKLSAIATSSAVNSSNPTLIMMLLAISLWQNPTAPILNDYYNRLGIYASCINTAKAVIPDVRIDKWKLASDTQVTPTGKAILKFKGMHVTENN